MITLVSVGNVAPSVLEDLKPQLERVLGVTIEVSGAILLPPEALEARRNQYRAPVLLSNLPLPSRPGDKVLGVTGVDIFASNLGFIFGQAEVGGSRALISLHRLRPESSNLPANEALLRKRALKEAVHELGHTLGLGHCPRPSCVMRFSEHLGDTDVKGWEFCTSCRARQPGMAGRR